MRHVNITSSLNNCRPGNGAGFSSCNADRESRSHGSGGDCRCQPRPAGTGPVDGLQSGQAIGGAALGNPRVAAPFSSRPPRGEGLLCRSLYTAELASNHNLLAREDNTRSQRGSMKNGRAPWPGEPPPKTALPTDLSFARFGGRLGSQVPPSSRSEDHATQDRRSFCALKHRQEPFGLHFWECSPKEYLD